MQVAILIDGGHLRVVSRKAKKHYDPDYIERLAHAALAKDETLYRILYYDCAPYNGKARLPVSGEEREFNGSDRWLKELAAKDLFAIRLGVLKFRGFKPKKIPIASQPLADSDFLPDFEQKGVDMRIGLDIASFSLNRVVDRLILFSNDTDCIPAMKHGRKAGLQIVLAVMDGASTAAELKAHADFTRKVNWP
ncbi:MAG: hypothetical protein Tsb0016_01650 [Sphingomonadales bacterium]